MFDDVMMMWCYDDVVFMRRGIDHLGAGKGSLGRVFLAYSTFFCLAVFLEKMKVPVPALKTRNFLPAIWVC